MASEASFEQKVDNNIHRLGEMVSKVHFDELLEYASAVCLYRSPDYTKTETRPNGDTPEQQTIAWLGLRGLRSALEVSHKYILPTVEEEEVGDDEEASSKIVHVSIDFPLKYPDLLSDPLNMETVAQVGMFGEELLREAYRTLGNDVDKKILELQQAATPEAQLEVIDWLDKRLQKMTRRETTSVQPVPSEHFYFPIRLSPKFIGTYPEHNVPPTCLGVSIIANSFFIQSGMKTLHAGVNEAGHEKMIDTAIQLADAMPRFVEKYGIEMSDRHEQSIASLRQKLSETLTRADAQHAAVLVQLNDDRWVQFDPNYRATELVYGSSNNELTKTAALLDDFKDIAPGLELAVFLPGDMTVSEMLMEFLEKQTPAVMEVLRKHIPRILDTLSDEAIPAAIFETCLLPFYHAYENNHSLMSLAFLITGIEVDTSFSQGRETLLENNFYEMFQKYVLWGDSLEIFQDRLRTDASYRDNRINDILALPFMTALAAAKQEAEAPPNWFTHRKLDIGLPAHRVGWAVLNDFDAYDDSALPDGFWMSYWPGNVSVIEHLGKEPFSNVEEQITYANALYYDIHPFTSNKNSGILEAFLDTREKENTDGKPQ